MSLHVPRWTLPSESPSKATLSAEGPAPRFQPLRFGGSFRENLSEWLKQSPRRIRGARPSMLVVDRQARSASFWRSQAVSLAVCSGAAALVVFPFSETERPARTPTGTYFPVPILYNSPFKLPPAKDSAHGGGGGGKRSNAPAEIRQVSIRSPFSSPQSEPRAPRASNPAWLARNSTAFSKS